ncbi:MAG: hypothetical protein OEZ08_08755 [Betaproteobacteria bacterium]|nr:hypothetical protein [Betaproteobacteria bacterium]
MRASPAKACARLFAAALGSAFPGAAWAHAFGERFDLPAPLGYFVAGAAATVGLSFVVAALFMRGASRVGQSAGLVVRLGPLLPVMKSASRLLAVVLLGMVLIAGLVGSRNPETNLAPILVWIIWWVGLSFVAACIGNIWPALDPWRALFETADDLARRLGRANGISLGWHYPPALGVWPAVLLLLLFVWIEVIYPRSALPRQLASIILAWSSLTLLGMICFGGKTWRRHADVFSLYFSTLGRFAPLAAGPDRTSIVLRPPAVGLIAATTNTFAMVGFVIAMLSTVLFDGLLGTQGMILARQWVAASVPGLVDPHGFVLGTGGLVGVWVLFFGAYLLACWFTARLVQNRSAGAVARLFALTLVPIAIAYNIAHYFSYLVVHGQLLIPLLSDPLGRGWDLLGTARYYPDIGLIDARFTWYLAATSIVAGHIISVWLAHRIALREFGAPGAAVLASVPLTILMVVYTAVSLAIMAEPLVQFAPAGS